MSHVVPLDDLGEAIVLAVSKPLQEDRAQTNTDSYQVEARVALTGTSSPKDLDHLGKRTVLTCSECGGVLWRIGTDAPLRYRCHTGHAFSKESLFLEQDVSIEDSLWSAVRKAEECAVLAQSEAELATADGDEAAASAAQHRHGTFRALGQSLRHLALRGAAR